MAADGIQQMLMDLQLDSVPLVPLYGHTPQLPLVLVSSPEEIVSASHDQDEATPSETAAMLADDSLPNSVSTTSIPSESDLLSQQTGSDSEVTTPSAVDVMTPILEEQVPISHDATPPPPPPPVDQAVSMEESSQADTRLSNGPSSTEVRMCVLVCVHPTEVRMCACVLACRDTCVCVCVCWDVH